MKPFNLQKALTGHPLVTRDGRTVTNFHKNARSHIWPFRAEIEGVPYVGNFMGDGKHTTAGEHSNDLFLADEAEQPNSDVPAGCKPFNLEAALAGAALVTRDGVAVRGFRLKLSADPSDPFPYIATVRGNTEDHFTREGRYKVDGNASMSDLFLVDKTSAVTEIPAAAPPQVPTGCKPFNLEAALAGAPLVTRDGRPVTDFKEHVSGRMTGRISGKTTFLDEEDFKDLFLVDTDSAILEHAEAGETFSTVNESEGVFPTGKAKRWVRCINRPLYTAFVPNTYYEVFEPVNDAILDGSGRVYRDKNLHLNFDFSNVLPYDPNAVTPPRPSNPLDAFTTEAFTIPTLLQQADKLIYGERQENYGSVTENFTNIAKGWNVILGKEVTPEQVGLCMAWLKIARQVNRPAYDNILDLAGYAGCIDKLSRGE